MIDILKNFNSRFERLDEKIFYRKRYLFCASLFLFLLSIFVRILSFHFDPVICRDGVYYVKLCKIFHEQGIQGILHDYPNTYILPVYLLLVNFVASLGVPFHHAWIALNIFMGSIIPILVMHIAINFNFKKIEAFFLGLLCVFHPVLVEYSYCVQREILFLFGLCLAILFSTIAENKKKAYYWIVSGCCTAIAVFGRYEGLFLPFMLLFYLAYSIIFYKVKARDSIQKFILYLSGFTAVIFIFFGLARDCAKNILFLFLAKICHFIYILNDSVLHFQ